jgi:predicted HAD superfamily phosphohydrolase YqeG
MIFASTPNKIQQVKLVNLIQESLGSQYIVKLINGDETTNRKAENEAKRVVKQAKREKKKVVLVSNDMASRSFSVSEIDTVFLFFDRGSYASITQKISRVLTP